MNANPSPAPGVTVEECIASIEAVIRYDGELSERIGTDSSYARTLQAILSTLRSHADLQQRLATALSDVEIERANLAEARQRISSLQSAIDRSEATRSEEAFAGALADEVRDKRIAELEREYAALTESLAVAAAKSIGRISELERERDHWRNQYEIGRRVFRMRDEALGVATTRISTLESKLRECAAECDCNGSGEVLGEDADGCVTSEPCEGCADIREVLG